MNNTLRLSTILAISAAVAVPVNAQIYWKGGAGTDGTWDTTTQNWALTSGGTVDQFFPQSGEARFEGVGYTVTLGEDIETDETKNFFNTAAGRANGMTFDLNGFTLSNNDGGNNIQFNGQDVAFENGTYDFTARNAQFSMGNVVGQSDHTIWMDASLIGGTSDLRLVGYGTLQLGNATNTMKNLRISRGTALIASGANLDADTIDLDLLGVDFGTLTLQSATALAVDIDVFMLQSNTLNLDFTGIQTVGSLTISSDDDLGTTSNSVAPGTYTAAQLAALGFGGNFSGDGSLTVVPEPSTYALFAGFMALGLIMIRRRLR
jgi:hypothetical protein